MLKDYYDILQIPSHASLQQVKQAYRRLAVMYHPDKTSNDPYALAKYNEVREAYEVLSNPLKKETYLQQRWYNHSLGKKLSDVTTTPVSILKMCLELEKHVSKLDVHRMDREGLYNYINELFSANTIEKLKYFNDASINSQIISTTLMAMKPLPLKFADALSTRLKVLAINDRLSLERIQDFLWEKKKNFLWNRYKVLVIVILTLLICTLIYLTSK
jgi:hypothetical protein